MVICLERGADLHMFQLMPLLLTVSCFSKIQIGFTFLVPAHPGSPGKRAVKQVCMVCDVVTHYRYVVVTVCAEMLSYHRQWLMCFIVWTSSVNCHPGLTQPPVSPVDHTLLSTGPVSQYSL